MTSRKPWDDAYYERNKEAINAKKAARYRQNREKLRQQQADYYQEHKYLFAQKSMQRYASKTQQTPAWLGKAHYAEMDSAYLFCQIFNAYKADPLERFQVDHILPLRGKQVSGLHLPWNLRVTTRKENVEKRNSFNPSKYSEQGMCAFTENLIHE